MSQVLGYAPPAAAKPPLDMGIRMRLSVMMFLQFAVWGAWFVTFGNYTQASADKGGLGLTGAENGSLYGTMALGAIISMMVAGQLADRVMSSEWLMCIFHLVGAALLYMMAQATSFGSLWTFSFLYALVYNPTLAISNSLSFANIPDATRDFPSLRVLGTIGWIGGNLAVDHLLPAGSATTARPLLLAAGLSAVLGLFSVMLPHTPPSRKGGDTLPFLKAFKLLRDPSFGIFFAISFIITIALAFYYAFAGTYLGDAKVENIPTTMSFGQMSEIGFMLLLPLALMRLGMKFVLAIGMAAWVVRYALFSVAGTESSMYWMILIGVLLHGVCFDFFLAAGFIHTENKAPSSIRGSAQALFSFLTYGVGMWIGNELSGRIVDNFTVNGVKDWSKIWMVPAIGAGICLVLFLVLWRDKEGKLETDEALGQGFPVQPVPADSANLVP